MFDLCVSWNCERQSLFHVFPCKVETFEDLPPPSPDQLPESIREEWRHKNENGLGKPWMCAIVHRSSNLWPEFHTSDINPVKICTFFRLKPDKLPEQETIMEESLELHMYIMYIYEYVLWLFHVWCSPVAASCPWFLRRLRWAQTLPPGPERALARQMALDGWIATFAMLVGMAQNFNEQKISIMRSGGKKCCSWAWSLFRQELCIWNM